MDAQLMKQTMSRAMPLLNTPFAPGHALEAAQAFEDADVRNIALAEFYYFSGEAEKASELSQPYLHSADPGLRLSALWIYGYANLALDRIPQTVRVLNELQQAIAEWNPETHPHLHALAVSIASAAGTLLHLPLPMDQAGLKAMLNKLPLGMRMFAAYVQAHRAYLEGHFHESYSIADMVLHITDDVYPIPMIYLHLAAVMSLMRTGQIDRARQHMLKAWALAQPDDLIEPFGEHHGLIGGMLEVAIKKDWPEDFRRMIAITYPFSAGWRKLHAFYTGNHIADDLTTTEFAVAMLAAQGWSNKEISAYMGTSANTVKQHISTVLQKLNISQRKDLARHMLK